MKKIFALILTLALLAVPMTVLAADETTGSSATTKLFTIPGRYDSLDYEFYVQLLNENEEPVKSESEEKKYAAVAEWKTSSESISFSSLYYRDSAQFIVVRFGIDGTVFPDEESNDSIKEIILPDTVKTIGPSACLMMNVLENFEFGSNIKKIGDRAFWLCIALKEINLPQTCTEIGNLAFSGCNSVKNLELPYGLQSIGMRAFASCASLENVVIPPTVTEIGNNAFENCRAMKTLSLPERFRDSIDSIITGCDDVVVTYVENAAPVTEPPSTSGTQTTPTEDPGTTQTTPVESTINQGGNGGLSSGSVILIIISAALAVAIAVVVVLIVKKNKERY